jgi:alpha-1,3-rhamnosyl/mannosyltransferase
MALTIAIDCRKAADYGIGTYIRGILAGFAEIDADVDLILLAPPSLRPLLPEHPRFRFVAQEAEPYSVTELFTVGRAAEREGADILHAPHYVIPFTKLPVVATVHDLIHLKVPLTQLPLLGRPYAKWMFRRVAHKARIIITPSRAVAADIEAVYPETEPKTVAIHLAVDRKRFSPGEADEKVLAKYGLSSGRYFLFVGNDKPHKNIDRLVKAFTASDGLTQHVRLAIVGAPVTRYQMTDAVSVTGRVSDEEIPELLRGAIALVQPSEHEGFGLPVLEAMASGVPVIISRDPALNEVAGHAAIAVNARDVEALAGAMLDLLRDEAECARLRSAGLARAERFSWANTANLTLEAYGHALR